MPDVKPLYNGEREAALATEGAVSAQKTPPSTPAPAGRAWLTCMHLFARKAVGSPAESKYSAH